MQTNWEKVFTESQLISLPEVYIKLQQVINDDDYSIADVAQVISFDPSITARLLRMVNSSYFGLATKVNTAAQAINYLGTKQVHDLVLATSMADSFSDMDTSAFNMHQFWRQSIYCAIVAQDLAALVDVENSEHLFIVGLLHNVGHLMMCQSIPALILQSEELSAQQDIGIDESEERIIGFNYAQMGAALLSYWNLPANLTTSIKYQLEPSHTEEYAIDTSILHIAAYMTHLFSQELLPENIIQNLDKHAIDLIQINSQQIIEIDLAAKESLNSVIQLLFPQL